MNKNLCLTGRERQCVCMYVMKYHLYLSICPASFEWLYSSDGGLLMLRVSAMRGGIFLTPQLYTSDNNLPLQSPLYTHTALVIGTLASFAAHLFPPFPPSSLFWFVWPHRVTWDVESVSDIKWSGCDLVVTSASDQICVCVRRQRPVESLRGEIQTAGVTLRDRGSEEWWDVTTASWNMKSATHYDISKPMGHT